MEWLVNWLIGLVGSSWEVLGIEVPGVFVFLLGLVAVLCIVEFALRPK